jgi:hypothetical protein
MRKFRTVASATFAVVILAVVALAPQPAHAVATVTWSVLNCDSFSAQGTSTAPYATIYAYNQLTGVDYRVVVPVTGGAFSGMVTFPLVPPGTPFNVEVWGTINPSYTGYGDPGYWDGEDYYSADLASCVVTAVPALGGAGLAGLGTLLALAGVFALRRGAA